MIFHDSPKAPCPWPGREGGHSGRESLWSKPHGAGWHIPGARDAEDTYLGVANVWLPVNSRWPAAGISSIFRPGAIWNLPFCQAEISNMVMPHKSIGIPLSEHREHIDFSWINGGFGPEVWTYWCHELVHLGQGTSWLVAPCFALGFRRSPHGGTSRPQPERMDRMVLQMWESLAAINLPSGSLT